MDFDDAGDLDNVRQVPEGNNRGTYIPTFKPLKLS